MELRQLRHFVTVAETLNFHRAAEKLNMAQPPLSVSIRKLEEEIGAKLFERGKRDIKLTLSGHEALRDAREALRHAKEMGRVARASASGETGLVRLAFAASATYKILPDLVLAFRDRYPNVRLELREGTNTQIVSMFDAAEIDLALIRVPTVLPPNLDVQTIEEDVLCAVVPINSPLSRKPRLSMQDLANEPFVSQTTSGRIEGLNAVVKRVFEQSGITPPISQEALQVHTIISLVESGLGVALLPYVCSHHSSKKAVFRKIEDLPPAGETGIAIVHQREMNVSAALRFREIALDMTSHAANP